MIYNKWDDNRKPVNENNIPEALQQPDLEMFLLIQIKEAAKNFGQLHY